MRERNCSFLGNNAHYSGIPALSGLKIGGAARRAYEPNLAQRYFRQAATTAIADHRETPGAASGNCARQSNDAASRFQSQGFVRERRLPDAESSGVTKPLANSAAANWPLAARLGVGHIGPNGAVAEWLKAAVC